MRRAEIEREICRQNENAECEARIGSHQGTIVAAFFRSNERDFGRGRKEPSGHSSKNSGKTFAKGNCRTFLQVIVGPAGGESKAHSPENVPCLVVCRRPRIYALKMSFCWIRPHCANPCKTAARHGGLAPDAGTGPGQPHPPARPTMRRHVGQSPHPTIAASIGSTAYGRVRRACLATPFASIKSR